MRELTFDNGDTMPALGLGTWKPEPGEARRAVAEALKLGYRHVDCAAIYGNEPEIGRALSELLGARTVDRGDLWITSKLWNDAHAPEDVRPALEKTLADLQLDYVDLYLVHWPIALKKGVYVPSSGDELIPLEELPIEATWSALEDVRDAGLCRHLGVSNFSVAKLTKLCGSARVKPEMNQIELHPYLQQPLMLETCAELGVHVTAYSPLGSPDRPDRLKAKNEPVLLEDPVVGGIAERLGVTPAQILIAWAIGRDSAVIPKTVHAGRMRENLMAAEITLTDEDMREIAGLDRARRYIDGSAWAIAGSPYTAAWIWDDSPDCS